MDNQRCENCETSARVKRRFKGAAMQTCHCLNPKSKHNYVPAGYSCELYKPRRKK